MATEGIRPSHRFSEEWPSLGGGSGGGQTALVASSRNETEPMVDSSQPQLQQQQQQQQQQSQKNQTPTPLVIANSDNDDDDWEDIEASDYPATDSKEGATSSSDNPRTLRLSISSPNLTSLTNMKDFLEDVLEEVEEEEESFSMISSVASVKSMDTTAQPPQSTTTTISWKDKVAKLANDGDHGSLPQSLATTSTTKKQPPRTQYRPMKKASRIVVVKTTPMRRSAKSTGDLPSLAEARQDEDDEETMGATDAPDFYHRKALGAASRTSGLRLRPDEAKRKQYTLSKKAAQRNGQR